MPASDLRYLRGSSVRSGVENLDVGLCIRGDREGSYLQKQLHDLRLVDASAARVGIVTGAAVGSSLCLSALL